MPRNYSITVSGSATAYQALPDGTAVRMGDLIIGYTRGGIANGDTFSFSGSATTNDSHTSNEIWLSGASVNSVSFSCTPNYDSHNVTINAATGGSVTASPGSAIYNTNITLNASPSSGYALQGYSASPAVTWVTANKVFKMPDSAVTITPTFKKVLTAVTAGNIIMNTDRSQKGIATNKGDVISDSHFSAGDSADDNTFNSRVLGL